MTDNKVSAMDNNNVEIVQIDSRTWRFEDGFVRFFLLEGESMSALIDSGVNSPDALEKAKELTDKPVMLINTHGDGDHTSGTGAFEKIHMHPADYAGCGVDTSYPDTKLVEVSDGDIIDLGNRPLEMIYIPGHTKGSLAILDVNARTLYAGDSVQTGHIFMFGKHRDPEQYERSLSKLVDIKDKYDKIYASHEEFCISGDYAEKVREAWQQVRSGEVLYEEADLFGNKVKSYTTKACGFFLD